MSDYMNSTTVPRARIQTDALIGVAAAILWLIFASVGVTLAAAIGLGAAIGAYINEEPQFSAPIEWRSNAESDDRRGEQSPVVVRLEPDGSAWVDRFPITPLSAVPFGGWAGSCFDNREGGTYTGPARWTSSYGGGVEIEVLGSADRMEAGALSQDWTAPHLYSCIDGSADIHFELVCGEPREANHGEWEPCLPRGR